MPPAARTTPFDGTELLLIDGTNLLYRLGTGAGGAAPASAIVGRIRGAVPIGITIDLVFDGIGHGVYGRLAQKMAVRYSGESAGRRRDPRPHLRVCDAARWPGGDRQGPGHHERSRAAGPARGEGCPHRALQWPIGKLDVPAPTPGAANARRPSIGAGRPPAGSRGGSGGAQRGPGATGDDEDRKPWKPGRGATAKTGTPKKTARHKRHPRPGA